MTTGSRLREHIEQLAPKLAEQTTQEDYSDLPLPELTDKEKEAAILAARKKKLADEETARYSKEYWEKLTSQPVPKFYSAEEIRNKLILSKTANGKRFVIDKDNEAQVNTLCLYFSGDRRLEEYGFSHSKGLLLMGGLGVGKTHLMSFFIQNQKASYVMAPCRQIENKWVNARPEDTDVIEYYSNLIRGSINGNPYNHQELGVCFDDLGTETVPSKRFGEDKNVLAEIILSRYDRKHDYSMTHFTTNMNAGKLKEVYGDRISDRLKEMCNVIVFPNEARSRRN